MSGMTSSNAALTANYLSCGVEGMIPLKLITFVQRMTNYFLSDVEIFTISTGLVRGVTKGKKINGLQIY